MKNLNLIVFFLITYLLSSCSKGLPTNNFTYIKVGNKQTYQYKAFLSFDTIATQTITSVDDKGVYVLDVQTSPMGSGNAKYYLYPEGNALYASDVSAEDVLKKTNINDKINNAVGDSWTTLNQGNTYKSTVVAKNVPITTSLGTFNCDKIAITSSTALVRDTVYFNDAVGQIFYDGLTAKMTLIGKNY